MIDKIKRWFTNNIFLKIISFILAVVIWFHVNG